MADSAQDQRRPSSSFTASSPTPQRTESYPLTPVFSDAQTSNASSNDNVHVFSNDGSRSNTPSSRASSCAVTSPESNVGPPKRDPSPQQTQHVRTSLHGPPQSRASPRIAESHAEAPNSGHHASQTLETIPQAALPPPVVERYGVPDHEAPEISSVDQSSEHTDAENTQDQPAENSDEPIRTNLAGSDRTDSWWSSLSLMWSGGHRKLNKSSLGQKIFGITSLTLSIVAVFYLSYRGYRLQQWQALAELYQVCQGAEPHHGRYDECQEMLKIPLPDPPYANMKRQLEKSQKRVQKRAIEWEKLSVSTPSKGIRGYCFYGLLYLVLLFSAYTCCMWLLSRLSRSTIRGHGSSWRDQRMWPANQQYMDPFSPVNVRIAPLHHQTTHPQVPTSTTVPERRQKTPTLPSHLRQKRQIYVLSGGIPHSDNIKRRSLELDESLTQRPPWKRGGLPRSDSISVKDQDGALDVYTELTVEEKEKLDHAVQIGDALKGHAENDLIFQHTPSSNAGYGSYIGEFRRKLHSKYPRLPYFLPGGADSSDDEPILTALGADPYDSFNPEDSEDAHVISQRKNVVLSGFVAVAMAQAGSALASAAGGAIGRNILVQRVENEAHDIHEIITTGKTRRTTGLGLYEEEKERFLSGVQRRTTRQEVDSFQ